MKIAPEELFMCSDVQLQKLSVKTVCSKGKSYFNFPVSNGKTVTPRVDYCCHDGGKKKEALIFAKLKICIKNPENAE